MSAQEELQMKVPLVEYSSELLVLYWSSFTVLFPGLDSYKNLYILLKGALSLYMELKSSVSLTQSVGNNTFSPLRIC